MTPIPHVAVVFILVLLSLPSCDDSTGEEEGQAETEDEDQDSGLQEPEGGDSDPDGETKGTDETDFDGNADQDKATQDAGLDPQDGQDTESDLDDPDDPNDNGDLDDTDRKEDIVEPEVCPSARLGDYRIEQLTDFGGRPVWSPDNSRIAFIRGEFTDAYEIDLETREITCLTCELKHPGFLRVHYMKDGDYLLIGPRSKGDNFISRVLDAGFYWMPADRSELKYLGERHFEGVAVSRESRKIAYTRTILESATTVKKTVLYVAEVTLDGEIVNIETQPLRFKNPADALNPCEAQDFLPGDTGLLFNKYMPDYEVFTVDFETGRVTNQSRSPYKEEGEGIFPDGLYTCVESDRHNPGEGGGGLISDAMEIDVYMLRLDGTGKDLRRLTYFSDEPDQKANNPVVSANGCRIAFGKGVVSQDEGDVTGEHGGVFLLTFELAE